MSVQDECDHNRDLSRRNILLAGTTLTAASCEYSSAAFVAEHRHFSGRQALDQGSIDLNRLSRSESPET
jgi:hypothetical protein